MGSQDQTIQCGGCDKWLNRARFSNNALKKYEEDVYRAKSARNSSKGPRLPNCRECTGGGRDEMFCQGCQKTYGLDRFSKAQRQKSDNAKCLTCSQEVEDRVADVKDAIEEQEALDRIENPSVTSTGPWGPASLRGATPSISYGNGLSGTASNTDRTSSTADSRQGWILPEKPSTGRGGRSVNAAGGIRGGGTDSGSDSDHTQSTVRNPQSSLGGRFNGGWDNFTPIEQTYRRCQPSTATYSTGGTNPGFAKQGAVRPDAQQRAWEQHQREQQKKTQAEEEEDDDEEAESGSDDEDPY